MSNGFVSRIQYEAEKAARVITIDEERVKIFRKGAEFTAEYLRRMLEVSPQEPDNGMAFLNDLRLKDVREALSVLLSNVPEKERVS